MVLNFLLVKLVIICKHKPTKLDSIVLGKKVYMLFWSFLCIFFSLFVFRNEPVSPMSQLPKGKLEIFLNRWKNKNISLYARNVNCLLNWSEFAFCSLLIFFFSFLSMCEEITIEDHCRAGCRPSKHNSVEGS